LIITEEDIPYSSAEKFRKFLIKNYISQILLAFAVVTMVIAAIAGVVMILAVAFFAAIILALVSRLFLAITGRNLYSTVENETHSELQLPGNIQFKCIYEDKEKLATIISTFQADASDFEDCDLVFISSDKAIQHIEERYFFRKYQTISDNIFLLEWHFDTEHFSLGRIDLNASSYQTIKEVRRGVVPTLTVVDRSLIMRWNEPDFKKRITISGF